MQVTVALSNGCIDRRGNGLPSGPSSERVAEPSLEKAVNSVPGHHVFNKTRNSQFVPFCWSELASPSRNRLQGCKDRLGQASGQAEDLTVIPPPPLESSLGLSVPQFSKPSARPAQRESDN